MRNPNNFGGVVYLGKHRRNPYAARVTSGYAVGADGKYRQQYKYIGYYHTKKEAIDALLNHNRLNTPQQYIGMTFAEVYRRWFEREKIEPATSRYHSYNAAFKKCEQLHNLKMSEIRYSDLEAVLQANSELSKSSINNIRIIMSGAYSWALANDIVTKDYSKLLGDIDVGKKPNGHTRFTLDELARLWTHPDETYLILIYIYTGCRASELLELSKDDVHLPERYFEIKKAKTQSGIRTVPIAECIASFFEKLMQSGGSSLIPLTYAQLAQFFADKTDGHRCHDTRVTFVSMMTDISIPDIITKKIVGHKCGTVTGDVYTQLDIHTMQQAVNKLPFIF